MVDRTLLYTLAVAFGLVVSPGARCDTKHVPSSFATIQEGIDAASFGDTVLVAPGIYEDLVTRDSRTRAFFLKDGVCVLSESGPEQTVVHVPDSAAQGIVYGRDLPSTETVVEGFTFTSVPLFFSGVRIINVGNITFRDCVFKDLVGAITNAGLNVNEGDLLLERCRFIDCTTQEGGAGLFHDEGMVEVRECHFERCGVRAILVNPDDTNSSLLIEDCTFVDCTAPTGAAIKAANRPAGSVVRRCFFSGNQTEGSGGAVEFELGGPLVVEDCLFLENSISGLGLGGALRASGSGAKTVRRCTFWGNSVTFPETGAAIAVSVGAAALLENNVIGGCRGAVAVVGYPSATSVESSCNVFWDNADGNAGGIYSLGPTDRDVDPQFCAPSANDYSVRVSSPCVEPGALGCGQIGAFGVGCGTVSLEERSWGQIKNSFHER